jgi:D-alanyl-D-alanine carboxypeptidase
MSAVISLENIETNKLITLTDQMLLPLGQSPVLYSGLEVTAENLLKATLIQSSNDAPEALAFSIVKENFINLMNKKAKELGMENTIYYDVHGLNKNNTSTTSDLSKLVAYIYKNHPKILEITKDNDFWLPDPNNNLLKFRNVNNFYYLPDFIGGKTGYLPEAKQTFVSVFKVNQKPTAIILLYSDNRMADTFSILNQLKTRF